MISPSLSKDPDSLSGVHRRYGAGRARADLRTIVDHLLVTGSAITAICSPPARPSCRRRWPRSYGVPAPPGWTPYEFPPDSRAHRHADADRFLASHAHPGRSSPTLRGKALRELLLCQTVPRPPPNVDFSLVENPNSTCTPRASA